MTELWSNLVLLKNQILVLEIVLEIVYFPGAIS